MYCYRTPAASKRARGQRSEHEDSRTLSALASLPKGGLEAVTRSLATEYVGRGVRVSVTVRRCAAVSASI